MAIVTALSVVAPSGENIAAGHKTIEVRSWRPPTLPLLDLLIVQNKRFLVEADEVDTEAWAVAFVDVRQVTPWQPDEVGRACSSGWMPNYYGWHLTNVRPILIRPRVLAKRKLYSVHFCEDAGSPARFTEK